MNITNIYLEKITVNNFAKSIRYDLTSLKKIAKITQDYFKTRSKSSVKILDIGAGFGAFTLPLLEYFEKEKSIDYFLDCFDISDYMNNLFNEKLVQSKIQRSKVICINKDAEQGLLNSYEPMSYDIVIITFVLLYIKSWKSLLDHVYNILKKDGLFIQGEIIGDMRNVDGKFDTDSPALFEKFWRRYFSERSKFKEWKPIISVSDLSIVFDYLRKRTGYIFSKQESFIWYISIKWEDLCKWISDAPVSSLGSGLTNSERQYLSNIMYNWLKENDININDNINLKWGFRISWLVKSKEK